jgi:peptidoglycan/LPS O-acetylase OafA/YrhL
MKRRWFLVVGVGIIVANLGFLFVFRAGILENPTTAAANLFHILGGVLMAVGGADAQPRRSRWYQFVGAGNVLIAVGLAASYLLPMVNGTSPYGDTVGVLLAICAVAGGGSLAFIGFDWIRGGRHFDLSTFERGSILSTTGEVEK